MCSCDGYRRILPEPRERPVRRLTVNGFSFCFASMSSACPAASRKRNLRPFERSCRRSPVNLNLVEMYLGTDRELNPLEVFSTDFTELSYAVGARKGHMMALVDVGSRCAL